jgi:hypothetical protein
MAGAAAAPTEFFEIVRRSAIRMADEIFALVRTAQQTPGAEVWLTYRLLEAVSSLKSLQHYCERGLGSYV